MSDKPLIIFTHGGGRFANQLLNYANLIAFCLEYPEQFDLINVAFWPYGNLLEKTEKTLCILPTNPTKLSHLTALQQLLDNSPPRLAYYLRRNLLRLAYLGSYLWPNAQGILDGQDLDIKGLVGYFYNSILLDKEEICQQFSQCSLTLLGGFGVRCWPWVKHHQTKIKTYLAFKPKDLQKAQIFINHLRKKYDYLIGIAIRQTDYKIWAKGRYFFPLSQYSQWIKEAEKRFAHKGRIGFLVTSDRALFPHQLGELDVEIGTGNQTYQGHYIEDMIELSLCDLIMTPPSTFSTWAAFMGNVPLLPLYEISQAIAATEILNSPLFDALNHPHLSIAVK